MSDHSHHPWQHWLPIAAFGTAAAIMLLPIAGMALGHGLAYFAMRVCSATGSGLAGSIANIIGGIPLIGPMLAGGGPANGLIGIGLLAGGWLGSRAKPEYANVIMGAAIGLSLLLAAPALLSGLSMGIAYLSMLSSGSPFVSGFASVLVGALGTTSSSPTAFLTGGALIGWHVMTCGSSLAASALACTRQQPKDYDV